MNQVNDGRQIYRNDNKYLESDIETIEHRKIILQIYNPQKLLPIDSLPGENARDLMKQYTQKDNLKKETTQNSDKYISSKLQHHGMNYLGISTIFSDSDHQNKLIPVHVHLCFRMNPSFLGFLME